MLLEFCAFKIINYSKKVQIAGPVYSYKGDYSYS